MYSHVLVMCFPAKQKILLQNFLHKIQNAHTWYAIQTEISLQKIQIDMNIERDKHTHI